MSADLSAFGLEDKIAIVTGASQGIGRRLALGLAEAGMHVTVAARTVPALEEVAGEIEAMGRRALVVQTDVRDVDQIRAMVAATHETFDQIDVLVNNAAWTDTTPALEVTEEEWDQTLGTSLRGYFFVAQEVAKIMQQQGHGKIINVGSNLGEVAFSGRSAYGAAKGGTHQLTRSLAYELAPHGIHVNAVAPCITETATRRHLFERPGYKEWITQDMLPIGRWAQPEDVLGPVLFLASSFSDMVVGHVLMMDGGWTIH